jgi:sarcosine oxidase
MKNYDCIVVGLGAMGSATTYQLAKAGANVLGIDKFSPPHKFGSSHGDTRVTRAAIGEGVEYSELALRSHTLWRDIEAATGTQLFRRNGCLTISGTNAVVMHDVDDFFANIDKAARRYDIPHRTFDTPNAIRARYPQFAVGPGDRAILDEEAGTLFPEACVGAQLQLAERAGATLLRNTQVSAIEPRPNDVSVATLDGRRFTADHVVIATGAWLPRFAGAALARHLTVTRQVLHWFEVRSNPERFRPENCPVFIWQVPQSADVHSSLYGFALEGEPSLGVKVSHEENGGIADPDNLNRAVDQETEVDRIYRSYIAPFLPDLGPRCLRTEICMYTRVDRSRFVIDNDPRSDRVILVSACSGHGFKHSAAIGEALAQQLTVGRAAHVDLEPFRLKRLASYLKAR